jgi:hypothetical protein
MANTFNAITTGAGGISTAGDTSGTFAFAKDGTPVVTISGTGVINATSVTGLTTALTVAQGGTGAATLTSGSVLVGAGTSAVTGVAPGTSGNVLTSNGTTWSSTALPAGGVTSLNGQTGAITDTDLYAIGSYINGRPPNTTNYAVNTTIAGSSLYSTTTVDISYGPSSFKTGAAATLVNTGTWRCVSPAFSDLNGGYTGHWVRIS